VDINVTVRKAEGDAYVVDLPGELDLYTSPAAKAAIQELIAQGHYYLVINLQRSRYIDSAGVSVLISALKGVREHGGAVNLVYANQLIKKIFEITSLEKIFGVFQDEQLAVKALARGKLPA